VRYFERKANMRNEADTSSVPQRKRRGNGALNLAFDIASIAMLLFQMALSAHDWQTQAVRFACSILPIGMGYFTGRRGSMLGWFIAVFGAALYADIFTRRIPM
jgi:hypothetical protein